MFIEEVFFSSVVFLGDFAGEPTSLGADHFAPLPPEHIEKYLKR